MAIHPFSVVPYPLCIGLQMCMSGAGTISTPVIQGAKLAVTGKYLGQVVFADNQDFCTLLGNLRHPCPIPITANSLDACSLVKASFPVNIGVKMQFLATNGDAGVIFCQTGKTINSLEIAFGF
ncbi:hypothetical protein BGX23_004733 [Mortierella sp. AD031]|nr:hypothetical protein BGX23_004733 [Mortierella sp. AD031]